MNLTVSDSMAGVSLAAVGILVPIAASMMAELACRLNGRASAAARHLIWTLAFVIMAVCVPAALFPVKVAIPILPAKSVETTSTALSRQIPRNLSGAGVSAPKPELRAGVDPATQAPHNVAYSYPSQLWPGVLLSLWLAGFLFLLFTALVGSLRVRGVVKRSRSVAEHAALWAELLSLTGVRRSTQLLISREVRIPIATGLLRQIVILPEAALHWPTQMIRAALIHELAHLRRNDILCSAFARLVASTYWFNPVVWFGVRSLQAQAEMAADDDVVVTELQPLAYAESLLSLVRTLRGKDGSLFPAIGMLQGQSIEARVERILDGGRHRLSPSSTVRLGTMFCAILTTAVVSMVRPVAALTPPVPAAMLAAKVGAAEKSETSIETQSNEPPAITDLRNQLPGTHWKAIPGNPLRGGLTTVLTFTEKTVAPAGYPYEVNRHDSTVRIFFNHGDTQLLLLTNDGRRLRFTFGGKDYAYELSAK